MKDSEKQFKLGRMHAVFFLHYEYRFTLRGCLLAACILNILISVGFNIKLFRGGAPTMCDKNEWTFPRARSYRVLVTS